GIGITDTTDAIDGNLDALKKVGLRVKTLQQTDPVNDIILTAGQVKSDASLLGKITSDYHLAVMGASAAQLASLSSNHKVDTVSVEDTAANISRKWSLLQNLTDTLSAVAVTDSDH